MLYDAARLSFRNGAGPFRCLAKLSFRPRSYQMVPLIMALRQEQVRLLVADDVGVGKTVEALLIIQELLSRRHIQRFAIVCLPHLCEQWQEEIKNKLELDAVIIRSNTQGRLDREIQGDTSVYEYYPYQIISIDYIKSETRRDIFIQQCPELIVVDEAHSCARPSGATTSQ
jgi:superfamily II DNA or RNA helicase